MRLRGDDGDVCNGTLQQKDSTENSSWVPVPYPNGGYRTAEADDICSKLNCGKSNSVRQWNESEIWLTCTGKCAYTASILNLDSVEAQSCTL